MKAVSGKEFASILRAQGWQLQRIRGSHHVFMKEGKPLRISVPIHGNRPLKVGLLNHLMKQAGIAESEL